MIKKFSEEANRVLDEIVEARRTIRAFAKEAPPKEAVEQVIKAGSLAPYAALAMAGRSEFRRFFVFERGTPARNDAARLVQLRAQRGLEKMLHARGGAAAEASRYEA